MLSLALLASAVLAASNALGDVGPVIPGIMACTPPGGPPIQPIECDDGHNCCIMPVYNIQGQLVSMAATCCIKGSACKSQRWGTSMVVFCEYPPMSFVSPEREAGAAPGPVDLIGSR